MRETYDKPKKPSAAMNQQPQMDEARAAVKQQLLRTLMQQAVEELSADSQEQIDRQISDIDIDLEPVRERIRGIVASKAGMVKENAHKQIRDLVDEEVKTARDGIDVDAIAKETLNAEMPGFTLSDDTRADVLRHVQEQVREQIGSLVVESTNKVVADTDIASAVNTAITSRIDELSADILKRGNVDISGLVEETVSSTLQKSNVMEDISSDVRKSLIQRIAERTLDGLGDADRLSHEARALITFDHDDLIAATTILRTRIIQDIARRTARSLGNREELAADAEMWISADDPDLADARSAARTNLIQHVQTELRAELQAPESIAKSAAGNVVDENKHDVSEAVRATRELLIHKIAGLAGEQLDDPEMLATRAAAAIPSDGSDVQRVVKATMALIVGEVISEAEGRLLHIEKLSSDARTRMPESIAGVEQAVDMLERMLVEEVCAQAHDRLSDTTHVAGEARELIHASQELDAAHKAMMSALHAEVAQRAEQELTDTENIAEDAWSRIDLQSEAVVDLVGRLQAKVLAVVAADALTELGRIDQSLPQAIDRIPDNAPELELLATTLRERIMATVLADTLRSLGQSAQKSASEQDMGLLKAAMSAVLDQKEDAMSWTSLSDMEKDDTEVSETEVSETVPGETEVSEQDTAELSKAWSVSELFSPGDGASSPAPEPPQSVSFENTGESDHDNSLLYVYGVLDVDALNASDIENIEGLEPGTRLQCHVWQDICAITSSVPESAYGGEALKRAMSDSAWTRERVSRHADILNTLPGVDALVPLPFGEVFTSPVDLDDFLSDKHVAFRDALSRLSNRKEFSVRLHVDMHTLREHYMASDARIDASLNDMTRGVAGFIRDELKLSAEAPDESEMATLIQSIVGNTHTRILGVAAEGLLKNAPANPDATHRVVLNASYLVSEAKEAEFRATVSEIAGQYSPMGVEIQLSGPWMAYHFTHIEPSNEYVLAR